MSSEPSEFNRLVQKLVIKRDRRAAPPKEAQVGKADWTLKSVGAALAMCVHRASPVLVTPFPTRHQAPRPTPTPAVVLAKALSLQKSGALTAEEVAKLEAIAHRLDAARAPR